MKTMRATRKEDNMKLSNLIKKKLTKSMLDRINKDDTMLIHLNTDADRCYGFFNDEDELVCYVSVTKEKDNLNWITGLEVLPPYRGDGLGKQLLDFTVKSLNATALGVSKNNEVAINMYRDYGFETSQDSKRDVQQGKRSTYKMYLKITKKEALEKSLEMWTWLMNQALQGDYYEKYQWFKRTNHSLITAFCFLCEYVESNGLTCSSCPIKNWSNLGSCSDKVIKCRGEGSPFQQWETGMILKEFRQCKAYAEQYIIEGAAGVVNLLEKAILELKIEELQEEIDKLKESGKSD